MTISKADFSSFITELVTKSESGYTTSGGWTFCKLVDFQLFIRKREGKREGKKKRKTEGKREGRKGKEKGREKGKGKGKGTRVGKKGREKGRGKREGKKGREKGAFILEGALSPRIWFLVM